MHTRMQNPQQIFFFFISFVLRNFLQQSHHYLYYDYPVVKPFKIDPFSCVTFKLPSYAVAVFGVGSLMYAGIESAMFVEISLDENLEHCEDDVPVIRAALQMVFIFTQMYFIFTNHKMNIFKVRSLAHFALMHMIATNLCIWFRKPSKEKDRSSLNFGVCN